LAFGENLTYVVCASFWPMHGVIVSFAFCGSVHRFTPHSCGCGVASCFLMAFSMLLNCFRSCSR